VSTADKWKPGFLSPREFGKTVVLRGFCLSPGGEEPHRGRSEDQPWSTDTRIGCRLV